MGVDTKLYISPRWDIDDVKNVIIHHVLPDVFQCEEDIDHPVKFHSYENMPGMGSILFCGRSMYFHWHTNTPLGPAILLSLGHNEQAEQIMETIANVLGGFLVRQDCTETYEMFRGKFWEEDGLTYFLKYAAIHDRHSGGSKRTDVEALESSITNWHKTYSQGRER